jgi:hypothetical protein
VQAIAVEQRYVAAVADWQPRGASTPTAGARYVVEAALLALQSGALAADLGLERAAALALRDVKAQLATAP